MLNVFRKGQLTNYKIFLGADTIVSFAMGLFGPFWAVFILEFGDSSIESLGFAVGIMILAQSLTAYFAGKFSDRFGRKGFMVGANLAIAMIIFSYTLVESLVQLYAVQVMFGIVTAISGTAESAFLGDITERATRGRDVGKLNAITGIAAALAMMGGGILVGGFGFNIIFYAVAGFFFLSAVLLLLIKEKRMPTAE